MTPLFLFFKNGLRRLVFQGFLLDMRPILIFFLTIFFKSARKEIKSTQDTKSASKYQAAANHNHEKVEVWSSVGCVTFEDHVSQPKYLTIRK